MSPSLKAFLALVFVAATGAFLIRPVLDAVDAPLVPAPEDEPSPIPSKRARPTPTPRPSPSPEASPTAPAGGLISGPFRTQPLFDRYPRSCLKPDPQVGQGRGIAVMRSGGRIEFGSNAGPQDPPFSVRATKLYGFNATGALYAGATPEGGFVASAGVAPRRAEPSPALVEVVWSPVSLCGLEVSDSGELGLVPGNAVLVREAVREAAFSPDGRRIAVVLEEGRTTSLWVADLTGTTLREVQRLRTAPRVAIHGWSSDAKTLYASFGPDSGLSFITPSDPPLRGGVVAVPVTGLEQCGDRVVGIVNGAVAEISTRGPDYLTPTHAGYTAASCSPDGGFIATIRAGRLVMLTGGGEPVQDLVTDSGYRDIYVDWGPSGAGLVFGRIPRGSSMAEVWYIPEGGSARDTGLTFAPGPEAIDWSASPPTGISLR